MQRLDRTVGGLFGDRLVEPRRRVVGVELLGEIELAVLERDALAFVVGLAEIAANQAVARVEAGRRLDVGDALVEVTFTDLRQTESEPRQRIALVELDRVLEGLLGLDQPHLRQVGVAEDRRGAGEVRVFLQGRGRRVERLFVPAEREVEFGEPRPREGVIGVHRDRPLHRLPRPVEVENGLAGEGLGEVRGGRVAV